MDQDDKTPLEEEKAGEEAAANLSIEVDDIDVPSIMAEIQSRVERRRQDGVYKDIPILQLEEERTGGGEAEVSLDPLHELIFLSQLARQYAEVTSYYPIGARRSPLGPFILLAKKVIRRFMTPYMDALFAKQREFNNQMVKSLDIFLELIKRERERSYHGGVDRYSAWVEMELGEDLRGVLDEAAGRFDPGEEILELGCGTGDFLAAALKSGREALGVEEDSRLARICQERDLRVVHARPIDYLEAQPSESLRAVFVLDMGERGDSRELLWMINSLADLMERGGRVVSLNHHPRSVLGVEEAFTDPTLIRLVHPDTLAGLFSHAGFREVEVSPLGEFSPGERRDWVERMGGGHGLESGELAELLFAPRRYLLEAGR